MVVEVFGVAADHAVHRALHCATIYNLILAINDFLGDLSSNLIDSFLSNLSETTPVQRCRKAITAVCKIKAYGFDDSLVKV